MPYPTVAAAIILLAATCADAALLETGTVNYGTQTLKIIYDEDLNVTWLDYTNSEGTWQAQMDWVQKLAVRTLDNHLIGGWRLPFTVDDSLSVGWAQTYDGTTSRGFNNLTSEFGHLYYSELGNKGFYATDGSNPQSGWDSRNTGPFLNLDMNARFWSETGFVFNDVTPGYPGGYKWNFFTANGNQTAADGEANYYFHAIALHDGKIATSVPEPSINLLLYVGLGSLGVFRALFRFGVKV